MLETRVKNLEGGMGENRDAVPECQAPQEHASSHTDLKAQSDTKGAQVHMLSNLIASAYVPAVQPQALASLSPLVSSDRDDATLTECHAPSAEVLVEVIQCRDKSVNGLFAWVYTHNQRPVYRSLSAAPRYMYYTASMPAWSGWWIAEAMDSDGFLEWFKQPSDASLPTFCKNGEHGSKVTQAKLTAKAVERISMIGDQAEKDAIRQKMMEHFGDTYTELEGSQRGLLSKTSPVIGVAQALEAQQRAIQVLHGQLAAETQLREAAEAHAHTMEEAFDTLQLRIKAQLPSVPVISKLSSCIMKAKLAESALKPESIDIDDRITA